MRGPLRRFLCDPPRGVAALEFALVLPFLMVLYLGTVELSLVLMASRKLGLSTATTADLVSHSGTIDQATVVNILGASREVLRPFDASRLTQRVSALVVDGDGVARVDWSVGEGMAALPAGSVVEVPAGLVAPDEGLVMAEAWLDYVSPIAFTLPGLGRFSDRFFIFPRLNDRVRWEIGS